MTSALAGKELTRALRRALQHLYDPVELRHNPLPGLLGRKPFTDPVGDFRILLINAIGALKPASTTPANSNSQRYHDLLTYRFIEQMSQKEVASDMALSLRHLQRLEGQALRALAESMASAHGISLDWAGSDIEEDGTDGFDQVQQEIDWLKKTYPLEKVALHELLRPALETLAPLFEAQDVGVRVDVPAVMPQARAHVVPLQQAMLHLAGLLAEIYSGGGLVVRGTARPGSVELTILAEAPRQKNPDLPDDLASGIALVTQVVETSGGTLAYTWVDGKFSATLALNAREDSPVVLVVDDNQDTLLLLERYLANSPYAFAATSQPVHALTLLEQLRPAIVILDVMLPEIDGWSLLAQVKQHPQGRGVPVIISTILPQEKLAAMLGADGFLKKPFTARQLLDLFEKLGI